MTVTKTEVVSVRVPPDVKAALVAAAEQERRSLASMVEFMVLDYCKTHGIEVAAQALQVPAGSAGGGNGDRFETGGVVVGTVGRIVRDGWQDGLMRRIDAENFGSSDWWD